VQRIVASVVLGMLVGLAILGLGALGVQLIESHLSGEAVDAFAFSVYLLAALGACVFVKRRHPRSPFLALVAYALVLIFAAGYVTFFITALISGVAL